MKVEELARQIDSQDRVPATEAEVASFEALIGHLLPDSYRRLLMLTGGGFVPGDCCFGKPREERSRYFSWMAALTDDSRFSLESCFRKPGFYPMPHDLLMIGDDTGGNPLAVSLRDDRFGAVFVMDHEVFSFDDGEQESIEEAEEYGLAMLWASSFDEFLENVGPCS